MAATKKKNSPKPAKGKAVAKKEGAGLGAFVKSKRFAHIRGAVYVLFSLFLVIAMVGYYASGRGGWLGSAGEGVARFFAVNLFGIGSFGFALLFFVYGMKLWDVKVLPWWKTFGSTMFWMLWASLTLGIIGGAWVKSGSGFEDFAGIGLLLAEPVYGWLSWFSLVLLLFVALVFLVLVHGVEIPTTKRKAKEPKAKDAVKEEKSKPKVGMAEVAPAIDEPPAAAAQKPLDESEHSISRDEAFEKAAMELFGKPVQAEGTEAGERKTENGEPGAEDVWMDAVETDGDSAEHAFTIDDRFEKLMEKTHEPAAGAEAADGVSFTIEGMDETDGGSPETESEDIDAESETDGEDTDDLDPDDYRRHIGLDEPYDPHLDLGDYEMPTTDLLEDWEQSNVKVTKEELVANKDRIVQTLKDYGIEITEISAQPGPTVTLYKIKPAAGVRISKIKSLEDDIALSLAALGIRIIAPIPGESNVGIEVPNAKPQIVAMKTMLESEAFQKAKEKMELPIAFGKTISNECFVTDLAKMPHLLMAGATGTGKSVGLNAVLASLLYTKHPSELKLVLVDPKKVEFSLYSALERHYLAKMPDEDEAVITDVKKVVRTLNSLCIEMDSRYDLLKQAKVRKITEYNEKFCKRMLSPANGHRYLPYIVVVIDEFGDLIMTAGKEVELPIARLAQLARAVGIHLIIATQRPTTNIITGTIKANFPARVAFRVTSGIDSKTILDTGGAQQLIGRGDMLISLAGKDMVRMQCALIDTPEIDKLVKYIGDQRGYPEGFELPEYLDENEEPNKEFDAKHKDEFFNDAARLVVASQFGSTSLLQRKLQLGYNRAGRIIDQLEAAGIVGPSNGSKPRDVLIHDEVSLEELLKSL